MKEEVVKKVFIFILLLVMLISLNVIIDNKVKDLNNINTNVRIVTHKTEMIAGEVVTVPLTITNLQMFKENYIYTYKIKINSKKKEYEYLVDGKKEILLLDNNNEGSISIKPNESVEILEIPFSTLVVIEQEKVSDNFVDKSSQELVTKLNNEVLFYNSKQEVINPETSDCIGIFIILCLLLYVANIILKNIKIKRYEM